MPLRVLIEDDSLLVRAAVGDMLARIPEIEICGRAENGLLGLERIQALKPDLVILDVEMPVMDGITALREMKIRKMSVPVLMLSVLTQHGARTTFEALELGALDFIPKPSAQAGLRLSDIEDLLVSKVTEFIQSRREDVFSAHSAPISMSEKEARKFEILVIGSSTGGPQSLQKVFRGMSEPFPAPILIVQHMPPVFTAAFAERLNQVTAVDVVEASDGMALSRNAAYVAPGNRHIYLSGPADSPVVRLSEDAPVFAHRPSIDYTLFNVVERYGGRAAGFIMTGMGKDGVEGILRLHRQGGLTLAQDEDSSTVFGMNRRAIEAGAVDLVVTPEAVPDVLRKFF